MMEINSWPKLGPLKPPLTHFKTPHKHFLKNKPLFWLLFPQERTFAGAKVPSSFCFRGFVQVCSHNKGFP